MMEKLVRGGALLFVLSMFVAVIYAQRIQNDALIIANSSQPKIENPVNNNSLTTVQPDDENKKLVKKTGMVSGKGAGASKGAFSASAYCFSGRTAMGHSVRRGLIAADPRVLRLGSKVYINAGQWSGEYLVSDTGGAIKGKRIDIWVPNCSEARKFGRRSVQIYSAE